MALGAVGALLAAAVPAPAQAAQTTITIAMAPPPAAARFHGPPVVAARVGSPFLYTLAATGTKPITFSATGLPAGLSLNTANGQITGSLASAGNYMVVVHASNAAGSDDKSLVIAAGTQLARTPPMGWNSYDSYGSSVTEAEIVAQAQAQVASLQPFGWNYIVVDFLWFDPQGTLDANGRYLPSPTRFPSASANGSLGFKPLADRIHALGLNFGIHIMRGVPRTAVTARSPIANSTFTTANAGNTSDACPWDSHMWGVTVATNTDAGQAWYDSIFAQYAQWGIDFVKVDDMINNQVQPLNYHRSEVDAIRRAIDKTTRGIVLSLSPGPMQTADAANLALNANMWRMVNDFWDRNGLSTLPDVFAASAAWQRVATLGVGQWPDADMLPLGDLEPRCPVHPSGPTAFTHNEQVTVMSLWSILPSPLLLGGNMVDLTADASTGPFTTALLTNDEVLAVNQDAAGTHGKQVLVVGTTEVWTRDLSGDRKAVALFNRGTQDAIVSATFAQLGVTGTPTVRDVWQRADVPGMTNGISMNVPWNGAVLLTLTPPAATTPDAGTGTDAGARDAGAGAGGARGTGGIAMDAGRDGPGAGVGGGAGMTGSAGAGGSVTGGGAAAGGATGAAGASGSGAGGGSGSGAGCSCTLFDQGAAPWRAASLVVVLLASLRRGRCRRGPRR